MGRSRPHSARVLGLPRGTGPWVELDLVDVEPPGHARYEHHRFATDTWNWEIPSGIVEPGEDIADAAAREVLEETGYRVDADLLMPLAYNQPVGGMSNAEHHVFLARDAVKVADPTDTREADRIEWLPLAGLQAMIDRREVVAGVAVTGLLQLLARHP